MNLFNQDDKAPEEDSPDLTDEEIAGAIPTANIKELGECIKGTGPCPHCPEPSYPWAQLISYARRRKPNLYSRAIFRCINGHEVRKTFVVNWVV